MSIHGYVTDEYEMEHAYIQLDLKKKRNATAGAKTTILYSTESHPHVRTIWPITYKRAR